MKQRIISGAIIATITILVILLGGVLFNLFALFIVLWGSYEFCNTRNRKLNYFELALMIAFCILTNLFFDKVLGFVLTLMVLLFALAVFDESISFSDAAVSVIESIVLGIGVHYMLEIEFLSKWMFGYIVIIAYLTDVFALFTGMKFGKHKLNERVSPKKTIEGAIGGWVIGCVVSLIYASLFHFFYMEPLFIICCSIVLPIVSQMGDLFFSLIKRFYGIKDFSKLIPGHGGLLDRFDSMLFVLLIYGALAVIIGIY